jgi:glycosyltransferase involved in cell wall biosynthesis
MVRFARMLKSAYEARGHQVKILSPRNRCFKWLSRIGLSKWGAYADEYLLFPGDVRQALRKIPSDALFVFCDQALGPWVPLVAQRPHVVHVHDLLALRSALGNVPENPVSITGRIYQHYIRRGFRCARDFISTSRKTREDLHRFGRVSARTSEVVHNGLTYPYSRLSAGAARQVLRDAGLPTEARGMLLHVGGGQWYKNLPGVVALYAHYAAHSPEPLPLWIIGVSYGSLSIKATLGRIRPPGRVRLFENIDNRTLQAIYSLSRALLFPSLGEGFGWPLIEAQACGCPVITTDAPPMNEVAGQSARYLPRLQPGDIETWADQGAKVLMELLTLSDPERSELAERGIAWAKSFNADTAIDQYLAIYRQVLDRHFADAATETEFASPR